MNEKAIDDADRRGATAGIRRTAAGFSWERWQERLERLCELGAMCADDEKTLDAFKRRAGCEDGQARMGTAEMNCEAGEIERSCDSLLAERAVLAGVPAKEIWLRRSSVSLGGACRMMFSADGVMAVNLPRDDDWQMLPALFGMLGLELGEAVTAWEAAGQVLESAVASLPTEDLVCAAEELGLAIAEVGGCMSVVSDFHGKSGSLPPLLKAGRSLRDAKIVDLSVMWAGPLCGDLLARAGAQVMKVESPSRPDGARRGSPEFYKRLNGEKQHRSIGLDTPEGQTELLDLLQNADIVLTSCRPRALEQLGIDPHDVVCQSGVIWAGITGYGWEQGQKVAFGDDAAAAGGLVCRAERLSQEAGLASGDVVDYFESQSEGGLPERKRGREGNARVLPSFIGDAISDPLTGVTAAVAVMEQWLSGSPEFLDISMVDSAAFFSEGD